MILVARFFILYFAVFIFGLGALALTVFFAVPNTDPTAGIALTGVSLLMFFAASFGRARRRRG